MSIELDWEITEEGTPPPDDLAPVPASKSRRPRCVPRRVFITLGLILAAAIATASLYVFAVYRKQLERAEREIRPIARLEAQAIVQSDRDSFLALQDPEDDNWRAAQASRFGRLEREGLPEFGWKSTGVPPQLGQVTLEPGGARLDVMYQFSVTHPLPNGPASITLRVPQFYKQTPSGWVHANGTIEYWGTWRSHSGRHFAMRYTRRDADILEPLIPRMDEMLARVCGPLPCPPQPIYVIVENSPDALTRLSDFSYGFDEGGFILKLPSPHLLGVPTDARSRDELYRAIGTRIVQALALANSYPLMNLNTFPESLLLKWELSRAGLDGPFITPQITQTLATLLQTGEWQSLAAIPLRSRTAAAVTDQDVALTSLAFAFLEQQIDAGAVERLIPTMQFNATLGEIIRAVWKVNPLSLEPEWLAYLRKQVDPAYQVAQRPPTGKLALFCAPSAVRQSSIWLIQTDNTGLIQVMDGQNVTPPVWSPDGRELAFLYNRRAVVADAETQRVRTVREDKAYLQVHWLPDGRLQLAWQDVPGGLSSRIVSLGTGQDIEITGTNHTWSPDGKWMAYTVARYPTTQALWLADADGNDARSLASGYGMAWSPDSKQMAFISGPFRGSSVFGSGYLRLNEISIANISSGEVKTLARVNELLSSFTDGRGEGSINQLTWSPDGTMLAMSLSQSNEPMFLVLDAATGKVRARWQGTSARWISIAWSADSRYVGFWVVPTTSSQLGTVGTLDVATGHTVTLPGLDFDWSPDGQWLAALQDPDGVFLVTPDLSTMRWLDTPSCFNVAWRPSSVKR